MDLLKILRSKIDSLEDGDYIHGLRAVLLHIETASRHLLRGQEQEEETAFTDAIYRTNQAFEGSLKEAYRVIASKDPAKETPFNIENYFVKTSVFRKRVLDQFTNYRTEWRNPSTHDYKLDFDENEAFLAIVSVSAFACLVLDQITEKLSYIQAKNETDAQKDDIQERLSTHENSSLLERAAEILKEFSRQQISTEAHHKQTETQLIGKILGFFESVASDLTVYTESDEENSPMVLSGADIIISDGSTRVLVEIKRLGRTSLAYGRSQLAKYMSLTGIRIGILYLFSDNSDVSELEEVNRFKTSENEILVLGPAHIYKFFNRKTSI